MFFPHEEPASSISGECPRCGCTVTDDPLGDYDDCGFDEETFWISFECPECGTRFNYDFDCQRVSFLDEIKVLNIKTLINRGIKEFYFDGCHKFYLVENPEDHEEMAKHGWSQEEDCYPIENLPKAWESSCPFRFISTVSYEEIIPQCENWTVV